MTSKEYKKLEKGLLLMTRKQANRLSDAYNIGPKYFLKSSRQLDLLLLKTEVIKTQKMEIRLQNLVIEKCSEQSIKSQGDEKETTHQ